MYIRPCTTQYFTRSFVRIRITCPNLHDAFGDVPSFLECEDLPPSKTKLLEILNDPPKNRKLQIELAIIVDVGEPLVKATYRLEGDGPLVFSAYEEIATLQAGISNAHYPNTNAVATKLCSGRAVLKQQLMDYADLRAKPTYEYFTCKFNGDDDLKRAVTFFKYARYFDPSKLSELRPMSSDVESLRAFPMLNNDGTISELKCELPRYIALADGVSMEVERELPKWSNACKLALLVQPSSAAAERVFSILSNCFRDQQMRSLEDYIETSVILQYNSRQ